MCREKRRGGDDRLVELVDRIGELERTNWWDACDATIAAIAADPSTTSAGSMHPSSPSHSKASERDERDCRSEGECTNCTCVSWMLFTMRCTGVLGAHGSDEVLLELEMLGANCFCVIASGLNG